MRLKNFIADLFLVALLIITIGLFKQSTAIFQDSGGFFRNLLSSSYSRSLSYDTPTTLNGESLNSDASQAIAKVSPSVVSVYGVSQPDISTSADRIYLPWFNLSIAAPADQSSDSSKVTAGSGFFVTSDGYILTNRHVVSDEGASYSVELQDGTKKDATVVYRDPNEDLAILKISGNNYPTLNLGDSSQLRVGQTVLSIGNAYGEFSNTVSQGTISDLNKDILASDEGQTKQINGVIQTSAQLYPGDSGGPTFDMSGNVIGVNVATATDRNNVSFSIPINDAKAIIDNVTQNQNAS